MIERLSGVCLLKQLGSLVVDVQGVGYGAEMTEAALARIEEGQPVGLWIHTHVREDAIRLFAFLTYGERQLFHLLLSIAGIGPKVAMAIIAVVPLPQLIHAIEHDDAALLEEVPGIGPRQSKKIMLELKSKLDKLAAFQLSEKLQPSAGATSAEPKGAMQSLFESQRSPLAKSVLADLKSALENFGYKDKELLLLLKKFERTPPARDLASLIRLALAEMSGGLAGGSGAPGAHAAPSHLEELF